MSETLEIPVRNPRRLLPDELVIDSWDKLQPYFEALKNREINSEADLEAWMKDRSEMEAVLEEDLAWRYIKMNIDTKDESLQKDYSFFVQEISPKAAPYFNELDKKLVGNHYLSALDQSKYFIYLRDVKQSIEIYRDENVALLSELQEKAQEFSAITGAMNVQWKGDELTLQQAANVLKQQNREEREAMFNLVKTRRLQDKDKLDGLFNELVAKRHIVAQNADFNNYRDYKFASLGRFDYTPQDCFNFHDSIEELVVPLTDEFDRDRKEIMKLDTLRPWDTEVDKTGKPMLKPFANGAELIDRTIQMFYKINPYFGQCLETMKEMGYLDLESKNGKAPGGFNYPLYEIGVPFIYMNAVGNQRDLVTMVHEGGHAVHSFLTRDLEITGFKSFPSEVAELASMSMELISMDVWDSFYADAEDLKRAKQEQLEKILGVLPWVATIDKFQHWIYENPNHSVDERQTAWANINNTFIGTVVDWSGHEDYKNNLWQRQGHVFEVPFYYIEYGMAQLGAIAVWRNYKQNPEKALQQYMDALSLGYTKSIADIYETAGIKFDFSKECVKELVDFVREELIQL